MTTIPQQDAGIAGFDSDSFKEIPLFTGPAPTETTSETVADAVIASADLPAYSVVGRDGTGKLVLATLASGSEVYPIGITTNTVKTGSTVKTVGVYRDGTFNPNALNWHASYDTAAKKRLAFEVKQPTIFIVEPGYPQP